MSKKSKNPNTNMWTIKKYAEEIYVHKRAKHTVHPLSPRSVKWYLHCVRRFEDCHGPTKLRKTTNEMIDEFREWLIDEGSCEKIASKRCEIIRAIVRHWRPGSLPLDRNGGERPADMKFLYSDQPGTLEHLFFDRYMPSNPRISSQNTITQYGKALRRFNEYLGHPATTEDLTDELVGGFQRWLVDSIGNRPVSANAQAKQIKALWNWAAKKRLVAEFPTVGKMPEAEPVPRCWTQSELAQLYQACRDSVGNIGPHSASDWWIAFHLLLWDTGERTGAMLAARWDGLDLKSGTLTIPGELRKGRTKPMVYNLKAETFAAIEKLRTEGEEIIFAHPWSDKWQFYTHYRRLIKSAGLTYEPHKTGPQKMRRTFASFIERMGGNATKALGHSTRRVTTESYLDPRVAVTESENAKLPSINDMGE